MSGLHDLAQTERNMNYLHGFRTGYEMHIAQDDFLRQTTIEDLAGKSLLLSFRRNKKRQLFDLLFNQHPFSQTSPSFNPTYPLADRPRTRPVRALTSFSGTAEQLTRNS